MYNGLVRLNMFKVLFKAFKRIFILAIALTLTVTVIITGAHLFYGNLSKYSFEEFKGADTIHFLDTKHSDCIILHSCGEYAIIDAGFGREWAEEGEVPVMDVLLPYIKNLTGEDEITFKYAISTHMHSDHASGFLDILENDNIRIENFYLKERNGVGNREIYKDLLELLKIKGVSTSYDVENLKLALGNFELEIYNGHLAEPTSAGDNDNSLAILVRHGDTKTLLAGDLTNVNGDETEVASKVGRVDLLKVPHHAHYESASKEFMRIIMPKMSIITNCEFTSKTVKKRLYAYCPFKTYTTYAESGIVAVYTDRIKLYNHSCG